MAKKIFISPSNQFNNAYGYGGTTEGVQCGRIAQALEAALKRCGFETRLLHDYTMPAKVESANKWGADLYVPIHTNAYNKSTSGTRIFSYDSTGAGRKAANAVYKYLAPLTPGTSESVTTYSDLYEIREPNAPTVYIECEFHDVPAVAKWIIEHVTEIAEAICHGICDYFGVAYKADSAQKPATTTPASVTSGVCSVVLPLLRKGDESGYVRTLQILLNKYNNAKLTEDGVFGNGTYNAVIAYQKNRKLDVDGVVGAQTWAQLLK